MQILFTADNHFFHTNIIRYCNRPFESLKDMNETMIRKWNERVKKDDLVFHIGDFGMSRSNEAPEAPKKPLEIIKERLNGNIIFIAGNHDKNNSNKTPIQKIVIKHGGYRLCLVHNPEHFDYNYEIDLVGHVHEKWQIKRYFKGNRYSDCINVGVDVWDFYPITWSEIWQRYSQYIKNEKTN